MTTFDNDSNNDSDDDFVLDDLPQPWDRMTDEPDQAYGAFRIYRDMPTTARSTTAVATQLNRSERTVRHWALHFSWSNRAHAWDDQRHAIEDDERLEAIRSMHAIHRRAGRAAVVTAVQALSQLQPGDLTPPTIARLLELGAKLERSTNIVSVEELQGLTEDEEAEDAWERIARELSPPDPPDGSTDTSRTA